MTTHTIKAVDWGHGDEYRDIIWDDETGAVSGDHSAVENIRDYLAKPMPLELNNFTGHWTLTNPAHVPVQFLALTRKLLAAQSRDAILSPELVAAKDKLLDPSHYTQYGSRGPEWQGI